MKMHKNLQKKLEEHAETIKVAHINFAFNNHELINKLTDRGALISK
jgi:hypothetical protein